MKRVKTKRGTGRRTQKNLFRRVLESIIRNVGLFIIGLVAIAIRLMKYINKLVVRLFKKLPKLIQVTIIYLMIALSIHSVNAMEKETPIIKEEIIKVNFTEGDAKTLRIENESLKLEIEKLKSENQKERTIKSLTKVERDIYDKSVEVGLTHEQAILVISISKHETGRWTSNAFKNKNNFGGVMCNTGLRIYNTYNDGLTEYVNLLKSRYFDKGLNTIEKIGAVYCPIGASNDPTGVNKYWIPNVTKFYNEYLNV